MALAVDIGARVANSSTIVAIFLALVTIFALHLSDRLQAEVTRAGGPRCGAMDAISGMALGAFALTGVAVGAMASSALAVLDDWGGNGWVPELLVYDVTWIALVALAIWELRIAYRAYDKRKG
jgi:hypothetical protein